MVKVSRQEIDTIHAPLLLHMAALAKARGGRAVVFLAGPPGSGKSTLAAFWEELARTLLAGADALAPGAAPVPTPVQALPLDGFHFLNAVLDARTVMRNGRQVSLRRLKGSPESFDYEALRDSLLAIRAGSSPAWPRYDRTIHEPVPGAIRVREKGVLIVEGNYLLLDEPGWRDLAQYKDLGIFVDCDPDTARRDLIARHCKGGRTFEDAVSHFELNDLQNRQRIMSARHGIDVLLCYDADRRLRRVR